MQIHTKRASRRTIMAGALSLWMFATPLSHAAIVLSDFENGAADYDNSTGTQTTGKFRDTSANSNINLSNNGVANDYLSLGGGNPTLVYDTTPNNTAPYSYFRIAPGESATVTLDFTVQTVGGYGLVGLLDPTATTANKGFGIFWYQSGAGVEFTGQRIISTESGGISTLGADLIKDMVVDGTPVRMKLFFTNNGANGTSSGQIYRLDALQGNELSFVTNIPSQTITYGTGAGQWNINPDLTGLEVMLNGGGINNGLADHLTFTIPEPTSTALLAFAGWLFGTRTRRAANRQ